MTNRTLQSTDNKEDAVSEKSLQGSLMFQKEKQFIVGTLAVYVPLIKTFYNIAL